MGKLENKVAIVTGAASGMGKEIALLFAKEGAKVIVSDLTLEGSQLVVNEISSKGGNGVAIKADVAVQSDVDKLIDLAVEKYGTLDILINNAGIMDNFEPIESVTDVEWAKVMAVNLEGPMRTIRKAMSIFKKNNHGIIVNISSIGGLQGSRAGVAYTASKHALIGLTKNIGFQYAKSGIRCNGIAPGAVNTNIGASITNPNQFGMEKATSGISLNPRTGDPKEIATTALFLSSDDSSFINGAIITADGGWTAY